MAKVGNDLQTETFVVALDPRIRHGNSMQVVGKSGLQPLIRSSWNMGARRAGIMRGDEVFLLQVGVVSGVFARGRAISNIYSAPHHDAQLAQRGLSLNYLDIEWFQTLPAVLWLKRATLEQQLPGVNWTQIRESGFHLDSSTAERLTRTWEAHYRDNLNRAYSVSRNGELQSTVRSHRPIEPPMRPVSPSQTPADVVIDLYLKTFNDSWSDAQRRAAAEGFNVTQMRDFTTQELAESLASIPPAKFSWEEWLKAARTVRSKTVKI